MFMCESAYAHPSWNADHAALYLCMHVVLCMTAPATYSSNLKVLELWLTSYSNEAIYILVVIASFILFTNSAAYYAIQIRQDSKS